MTELEEVIENLDEIEEMYYGIALKNYKGDKTKALQFVINHVEGDESQLSDTLRQYAIKNKLILDFGDRTGN
ncbi:Uncharacterised protein [uncultured archaeon]|nr:Uncharacterised protein [uncultured archaeon]